MTAGTAEVLPTWSDQSAPLQLVAFANTNKGGAPKLVVKADAKKALLKATGDGPAKVVAVCGLYRTGKSLLLNLLAGTQGAQTGFAVGDSVRACTAGIWVRPSKPEPGKNGSVCLLLDCEGTGNTERDREHDARLFALAVLLSSFLVFNSRGVLDERAIQALAMAAGLAQHIHKQHKDVTAGVHPSPAFLWALRDFTLALEDTVGNPITAKEYLEKTLTEVAALPGTSAEDSKRAQGAKEARETIKDLFPRRDCATLVRPVDDEEKLNQLSKLPLAEFRPKFVAQVNELRETVFNGSSPLQTPTGKAASCGAFIALLEAHVEVMNNGGVPQLGSVWIQVSQQECGRALDEALAIWSQKTFQVTASLPMSDDDLNEILAEGERAAKEKFAQIVVGDNKVRTEAEADLTSDISKSMAKIRKDNEAAGTRANEAWLRTRWETRVESLLKDYRTRHDSNGLAEGDCAEAEKKLQEVVAELRSTYAMEAVGPQAARSGSWEGIVDRHLQAALKEIKQWQGRTVTNQEVEASAKRAAEDERQKIIAEGKQLSSQAAKEVEESKARTAKLEAERRAAGGDGVQEWDAGDRAAADAGQVQLQDNED